MRGEILYEVHARPPARRGKGRERRIIFRCQERYWQFALKTMEQARKKGYRNIVLREWCVRDEQEPS